MRSLITNNEDACTGCNRCIRVCPVDEANIAYTATGDTDDIKVRVDNDHCVACGACIWTCGHDVRDFEDDTERFLDDLRSGVQISLFSAPAARTGEIDDKRILAWLKGLGVRKIYDVSLGADICSWAHIRHIEQNSPGPIITQPCPVIVNYILMYKPKLAKYLSPVQSPMLCTAIYMKKYDNNNDRIAALSPCIAKAHEFETTGYVHYNVTLRRLYEYIRERNITLPSEGVGFDHPTAALGRLYSMPGGLKENIEFYFGKNVRIDQSEGTDVVFKALDTYAETGQSYLPAIFDVLNCGEGCNLGTAITHVKNRFEVSHMMEQNRRKVLTKDPAAAREQIDAMFAEYDTKLRMGDFLRQYSRLPATIHTPTHDQLEHAWELLEKPPGDLRKFDCMACGAETCDEMAKLIAIGLNISDNCIQKERAVLHREHKMLLEIQESSINNSEELQQGIEAIKHSSEEIEEQVQVVSSAIKSFDSISKEISTIASHINLISLNASIEAARAGVHGRAFSVVAEEIRGLANRSKQTVADADEVSTKANVSVGVIHNQIEEIVKSVGSAHHGVSELQKTIQGAE